jgi:hypothetical protein
MDALSSGDSWSLFALGDGVQPTNPDELKKRIKRLREEPVDDRFRDGTRIAEGLLATRLAFPAGKGRRVALYSDGIGTERRVGEIATALRILSGEGIDVRMRALQGFTHAEAAVLSLSPSSA